MILKMPKLDSVCILDLILASIFIIYHFGSTYLNFHTYFNLQLVGIYSTHYTQITLHTELKELRVVVWLCTHPENNFSLKSHLTAAVCTNVKKCTKHLFNWYHPQCNGPYCMRKSPKLRNSIVTNDRQAPAPVYKISIS